MMGAGVSAGGEGVTTGYVTTGTMEVSNVVTGIGATEIVVV